MTAIPPCPERDRARSASGRLPAPRPPGIPGVRGVLGIRSAAGLAALALVAAACASSPDRPGGDGAAIRVTWRDYRTGNLLELLSESHTSKVDLYSEKRDDAASKVQEDVFMKGLVEFLALEGFDARAGAGRAPREGRELWTQSLEVERDGVVSHMAVGPRTEAAERLVFQKCVQGFIELYNATQAYQSVENPEGDYDFRASNRGPGGR